MTISGKLVVIQTGSAVRKPHRKRIEANLRGLGLGRPGRKRVLEDTPAIRGMIVKVAHLVVVEEFDPHVSGTLTRAAHLDSERRSAAPSKSRDEQEAPWLRSKVQRLEHAVNTYKTSGKSERDRKVVHGHLSDLLDAMYQAGPRDALVAAYAVLKSSDRYAIGLPKQPPTERWSHAQQEQFRVTLTRFLEQADKELITTIDAHRESERDGMPVVVVNVIAKRVLPFKLNGHDVPLKRPRRAFRFGTDNVKIGCAVAHSRLSVDVHGDMNPTEPVAMKAEARFIVPEDELADNNIPITVISREFELVEEVAVL